MPSVHYLFKSPVALPMGFSIALSLLALSLQAVVQHGKGSSLF